MKGIVSKAGKYGGTWVVMDIAINFMFWLNPRFQVWFIKEFKAMKEKELNTSIAEKSGMYEWFLQKIEDNALENNRLSRDLQELMLPPKKED